MATTPNNERDEQVLTQTRTRKKLKRPRLFRVLLHNDNFTPRDFVVMLLINVFQHSESDAFAIMLKAHNSGASVAGVFPFSVAETKVAEVESASDKAGYPLLCSMEPDGDGEEGDG